MLFMSRLALVFYLLLKVFIICFTAGGFSLFFPQSVFFSANKGQSVNLKWYNWQKSITKLLLPHVRLIIILNRKWTACLAARFIHGFVVSSNRPCCKKKKKKITSPKSQKSFERKQLLTAAGKPMTYVPFFERINATPLSRCVRKIHTFTAASPHATSDRAPSAIKTGSRVITNPW